MAINPIQIQQKKKSGGGLFGKVAGGLAAVAAAPFTGGASLAAAPALGAIGGAIGEAAKPSGASGTRGGSILQSAAKANPEVQLAQVLDAKKASLALPLDQQKQVSPLLDQTVQQLRTRLG